MTKTARRYCLTKVDRELANNTPQNVLPAVRANLPPVLEKAAAIITSVFVTGNLFFPFLELLYKIIDG